MACSLSNRFRMVGTALLAPVLLMPSSAAADDEVQLARAVAEGWRSNRESFSTIRCRYRQTVGAADSREQALRGEISDTRSVEVLWLVDGVKQRCSVLLDEKGLREVQGSLRKALSQEQPGAADGDTHTVSFSGFVDRTYLAFGDVRMHTSSVTRGMTLYGPEFPPDDGNQTATPFSMGVMGPGATLTPANLIQQWLDEDRPIEIGHTVGPSGRALVSVRLGYDSGGTRTYEFDLERGCLTERITVGYDDSGETIEVVITDMQECSNGHWFPMRSVRMNGPVDRPETERRFVKIIEVIELDVDHPPPAEEFAITFPAGAYVNERSDARSQFNLSEPTTVTPDTLPQLLAQAKSQAELRRTYESAKVIAQQPHRLWLTILTITVLVLLGVGFVVRRYWWAAK